MRSVWQFYSTNLCIRQVPIVFLFQALSALSNHAANLTHKLEVALKHQENFLKKMKQYKSKESKNIGNESTPKQSSKPRKRVSIDTSNEKDTPQPVVLKVDSSHCLIVVKRLLTLLLGIDHSCSADMFLLSCKVRLSC